MRSKTFKKLDGTLALTFCAECKKENYAMNVLSGICTWCGFDVNKTNNEGENEKTKTN